jgi:hypothetical protein
MLEEAERRLPLLLWRTRSFGGVAGGRKAERGSREAKGREGERPKEEKAQESQGRRTRRDPATVCPNRQRDETPEARPQRRQGLRRRKRKAPRNPEGRIFTDPFEERVVGLPIWGRCDESRLRVRRNAVVGRESQEGMSRREARRSLLGYALKGGVP